MTPTRTKPKPKIHIMDNYDITNLGSDDSTDDEEAPRKKIPAWAQGKLNREKNLKENHIYLCSNISEYVGLCQFSLFRMEFSPN